MRDISKFEKLRENEREVRKGLLIEAALKLLSIKPFDEIGMRDIASDAGVSAAAIYRYFPSREDLFVEAFIKDLSTLVSQFQKRIKEKPIDIEEFASSIVDHLIDNEATFQMMSYLMIKSNINSNVINRFNAVQRIFLDKIGEMFELAGYKEDTRLISHAFYSSLLGVLMTFRNYPGRSREEIKKHIHRLTLIIATVFKNGMMTINENFFQEIAKRY